VRFLLAASVLLAALCATLFSAAAPATDATASADTLCRRVPAPQPRVEHLQRPRQTVTRQDRFVAIVKTSCGRFVIKLDARRFPVIVNSFVYLARSGFYDGLGFYRAVRHFVIQAGDPRENGTGGPGYSVTEAPPGHFRYRVGTVAMAKAYADPRGRAGSIFFVVVGQGGSIGPDYAGLGRVRSGMATVRAIAALATPSERPSQAVRWA